LANSAVFRNGILFVVMILMGWTLQPRSIARSIRQPLPSLLAILINVAIVPLLAWPAILFLPEDLAGGLIVASLVPCTLASASVWTRSAGGDDSIAMVTTVVTNLSCFLVAPIGIWLILGRSVGVDLGGQMLGLFLMVVAPLCCGQLLRLIGFAGWADKHKRCLSTLAQMGILAMVLLGSVISAERLSIGESLTGGAIALTAICAWVVHLIAVGIGFYAASMVGAQRPQQLGTAIACGQKTLMVGLQLALDGGVSVLPMILYHVGQLIIDSLLVRWWTRDRVISTTKNDLT
jgi:sodium/bile acid cotransporter 7